MENRITIEGRGGAFGAYITRPKTLPAPAVVVLHEVFGVNADIRKTCDELADQGLIAIAPDIFWRQEPGVDLSVTSEPDWQHGLQLYQAYDRDAGAKEVKDSADAVAKLPECSSRVAVLGYRPRLRLPCSLPRCARRSVSRPRPPIRRPPIFSRRSRGPRQRPLVSRGAPATLRATRLKRL